MRYVITGKNIDVTEGLRNAVQEKIGKLEKYFTADTEVYVTLSVEKERQKIEVTIPVKGNIIRSEQVSSDMYVSIDLVEEIRIRSLIRNRQEIILIRHSLRKITMKMIQLRLSELRNLELSRWILKKHVFRWNS